jgi:predicted Zn-ribbon and HTH transcriptional regulator
MIPGGCPKCKGTDIRETHVKSQYIGEYVLATCKSCGNVWTTLNAEYPCDCDICKYRNGCPAGQANYALRMQHCNTGCFEPES